MTLDELRKVAVNDTLTFTGSFGGVRVTAKVKVLRRLEQACEVKITEITSTNPPERAKVGYEFIAGASELSK